MDFYLKIVGHRIFYIPKRICKHESTKRDGVSHTFLELSTRLVTKKKQENLHHDIIFVISRILLVY